MINYYALWIPSYQEEFPAIQRNRLDEVILRDIPGSDTIRLQGEIDPTSFQIRLRYFWYHAYLDTINFKDSKASKKWGITGGILGLLSIAITLFSEYKPSKPETPDIQSLKADSLILIKQDNLTEKINELIKYCKPDTVGKNNSKKLQKK